MAVLCRSKDVTAFSKIQYKFGFKVKELLLKSNNNFIDRFRFRRYYFRGNDKFKHLIRHIYYIVTNVDVVISCGVYDSRLLITTQQF